MDENDARITATRKEKRQRSSDSTIMEQRGGGQGKLPKITLTDITILKKALERKTSIYSPENYREAMKAFEEMTLEKRYSEMREAKRAGIGVFNKRTHTARHTNRHMHGDN
jgi:hypothetical protein